MIARAPIAAVTLRALLDRRRTWLMVGIAAIPVLLVALAVVVSDPEIEPADFDDMIVTLVLPLIALVFGTSAIGTELDEGTIVYLLTKPVRRLRIVLSKAIVASGLAAALIVPSTLLTGVVASLGSSDVLEASFGYAIAAALGAIAYVVVFMAVSTFTRWALAIGLVYVLLWEGVLSGLLTGTSTFSIRQATLAVAKGLTDTASRLDPVTFERGVIVLVIIIIGGIGVATWRLSRYQLRGGD